MRELAALPCEIISLFEGQEGRVGRESKNSEMEEDNVHLKYEGKLFRCCARRCTLFTARKHEGGVK